MIWTFGSQFIFDPLGLREKIFPLVERGISIQSEFEYHLNEMNKNEIMWQESFRFRNLIYSLYHGLSCYSIMIKNSIPPIHFQRLVKDIVPEHQDELCKLVDCWIHEIDFYPKENEISFLRELIVWLGKQFDDALIVELRRTKQLLLPEMVDAIGKALVPIADGTSWRNTDDQLFKMV